MAYMVSSFTLIPCPPATIERISKCTTSGEPKMDNRCDKYFFLYLIQETEINHINVV